MVAHKATVAGTVAEPAPTRLGGTESARTRPTAHCTYAVSTGEAESLMPIIQKSATVLRFGHRMLLQPEAVALPHPARLWLYGVAMEWTGFNNGVIEFCRHRHGQKYALDDRKMFQRARRLVLDTGLVEITRDGGENLPALYLLTRTKVQARPPIQGRSPIVGGGRPPVHAETGGPQPPRNWNAL
jgi:hypothetical protein